MTQTHIFDINGKIVEVPAATKEEAIRILNHRMETRKANLSAPVTPATAPFMALGALRGIMGAPSGIPMVEAAARAPALAKKAMQQTYSVENAKNAAKFALGVEGNGLSREQMEKEGRDFRTLGPEKFQAKYGRPPTLPGYWAPPMLRIPIPRNGSPGAIKRTVNLMSDKGRGKLAGQILRESYGETPIIDKTMRGAPFTLGQRTNNAGGLLLERSLAQNPAHINRFDLARRDTAGAIQKVGDRLSALGPDDASRALAAQMREPGSRYQAVKGAARKAWDKFEATDAARAVPTDSLKQGVQGWLERVPKGLRRHLPKEDIKAITALGPEDTIREIDAIRQSLGSVIRETQNPQTKRLATELAKQVDDYVGAFSPARARTLTKGKKTIFENKLWGKVFEKTPDGAWAIPDDKVGDVVLNAIKGKTGGENALRLIDKMAKGRPALKRTLNEAILRDAVQKRTPLQLKKWIEANSSLIKNMPKQTQGKLALYQKALEMQSRFNRALPGGGSDTYAKLAQATKLSSKLGGNVATGTSKQIIDKMAGWLVKGQVDKVEKLLVDAVFDPKLALKLMGK